MLDCIATPELYTPAATVRRQPTLYRAGGWHVARPQHLSERGFLGRLDCDAGWAVVATSSVELNGQSLVKPGAGKAGTFLRVKAAFKPGDVITATLGARLPTHALSAST